MARKVIPGCAEEGALLEQARIEKKKKDRRYTQNYTASLVGKGQYIWSQWHSGQTRIIDRDWIRLSNEIGFNPFETRPYLLQLADEMHKAKQRLICEIIKQKRLL
jgi:hypothetical protein